MKCRIILFVAALFAPTLHAAPTQPLIVQPELVWARSYLLHQILLAEYVTYAGAPHVSAQERAKRLTSDQGMALWKRAQFALSAAKAARQDLGETTAARALLLEQMALVKKKDPKAFRAMQAFEADDNPELKRAGAAATFEDGATREFVQASQTDGPTCVVAPAQLKKLWDQAAEADATRLAPVLETLRGASPDDVRCATVTWLRNGGEKERASARVVVEGATHVATLSQDVTLALLKATLLLGAQDYAEALRILFDQQNREAAYRAPYDLVQVIFSRRQAGDGSVHIRGL